MAFLDSSAGAADQAETAGPPPGGGGPPGPPQGGGPILAAIANRQRGPQVSAPGQGDMGQSIGMVTQAYGMLKQALPGLPHGSPIEQDVLKMVQRLGRHFPAGQPTMGQQQTTMQDMVRNLKKNAILQMIMQQIRPGQGGGPGGPPGGGGGGPAGAMAQAPNPSTPLPGA